MKICKHCGTEHNLRGSQCRVCKDGLYRYKMTRNDMIKMYEEQNRRCFLCETDVEMFKGHAGGMIDHDHKTGKVRGILCNRCNTLIGTLETHKNTDKVIEYLGMAQ